MDKATLTGLLISAKKVTAQPAYGWGRSPRRKKTGGKAAQATGKWNQKLNILIKALGKVQECPPLPCDFDLVLGQHTVHIRDGEVRERRPRGGARVSCASLVEDGKRFTLDLSH